MSRSRDVHRCSECGATTPRWLGRCSRCEAWGTLEPVPASAHDATPSGETPGHDGAQPVMLGDVDVAASIPFSTGVNELDRVLGGGLVPGSVTLLGGEPGVGKSTLALEVLGNAGTPGSPALLQCGEESPAQIRGRAERLSVCTKHLMVLAETDVHAVCARAEAHDVALLAVDSIQTLRCASAPGSPGSPSQVLACAQALVEHAKRTGVSILLVGHVTKEGDVAGPRALEHVVDTVLHFEGDNRHALRMLRARKHRYGGTDELGCFEMRPGGLVALTDPSTRLLEGRPLGVPGSVAAAVLDGSRPLLVEAQALVAAPIGPPSRRSSGLDSARVALVTAVLEQRAGVSAAGSDVFTTVTGGVTVSDPAFDLALLMALTSAVMDKPLDPRTIMIGEVGLAGEVRPVPRIEQRVYEAVRHGFEAAVIPAPVPPELALNRSLDGFELIGVAGISEIVRVLTTTDLTAA